MGEGKSRAFQKLNTRRIGTIWGQFSPSGEPTHDPHHPDQAAEVVPQRPVGREQRPDGTDTRPVEGEVHHAQAGVGASEPAHDPALVVDQAEHRHRCERREQQRREELALA